MNMIPVNLAIEDDLSEAVLRRLLAHTERGYAVGTAYGRGGFGYLRSRIAKWNQAAQSVPFVVLTDLDRSPCPAALIQDWLTGPRHPNLLLRVAVHEVEAWLLADAANFARNLRIAEKWIPADPDGLPDPKAALVRAASMSRSREVRDRVVPKRGSTAKQGRDYNCCLCEFVRNDWDVACASAHSASLRRAVERLRTFTPVLRRG